MKSIHGWHVGWGLVAFALLLAGSAVAFDLRGGGSTTDTVFRSSGLQRPLHYQVWLPYGYASSGLRYPVIYVLHGLPAGTTAYHGLRFVATALARLGRPAILVAPQGASAQEPDPEYLDKGPGRRWETAIAVDLTREIDSRYRTIPNRRGRALVGISAGGYGAMLIGLHDLSTFAAIESWSGYFRPTDPTGRGVLDLGSLTANAHASAYSSIQALRSELRRDKTFLGFYVGKADKLFLAENVRLDRDLTKVGVPHVFRVYSGAHDSVLWRAHARAWLDFALDHLSAAG
jgi:enterochelin esterase-like enzyme